MSMPLEHDYIGLSPELIPSMEKVSDSKNASTTSSCGLHLKATELRLGLPGSESPAERENNGSPQLSISLNKKSFVSSGAKRGFSVAIHDGSGNWAFSGSGGSDAGKAVHSGSGSGQTVNDGLPQSPKPVVQEKKSPHVATAAATGHAVAPTSNSKAQVVGWPPIRSFRKNTMASQPPKNDDGAEIKSGSHCLYVKVSMDGAPYLRKVDLKTYGSYMELSLALEKMFSCFKIGQCGSHGAGGRDGMSENGLIDLDLHGSEYVLTYEDKDGDWMLVGDVPWKMFSYSCRRLRITKSSEAIGLAPRAMEKCKSRN